MRWKNNLSRPHRFHEGNSSHNFHYPFQIVGKHMQTHLYADAFQRPHLEMCRPHPGFNRAKGMFNGFPSCTHAFWFAGFIVFIRLPATASTPTPLISI